MKRYVWSKERGLRCLKPDASLDSYRAKYPSAIQTSQPPPTETTLKRWHDNGGCKAVDGCWVEPDGICTHGCPAWLMALGWI